MSNFDFDKYKNSYDKVTVSDEIKKSLSQYSLKVYPKIIKVENILEYILLGAMILSAKE